ncbi:erythromycin esterase family protein [Corallococcus sp. Z5C101001]|uniref:erythromycin esterase family protein n=1 Tax=Corallococcus sp. Z5C101001 TaxID=2596829 RepID=UPI00117EA7A5|nr:erythromycin esterase family protein [Corallococcus sp. Z5C101001]TSC26662.1 erythromycin esterase family protein [Corallococcus sp. Z5C101001]
MRWHWTLGLLCVGCASLSRGLDGAPADAEPMPTVEKVYLVPLDEAMFVARRLLEEQRLDIFENNTTHELYSQSWEIGVNARGNRTFERYLVRPEAVGPRQSLVRIFRLQYREADDAIMQQTPEPGSQRANDHTYNHFREAFTHDTFEAVPTMEGFKLRRGFRDLPQERKLLARLEMVPSLELVGGKASIPVREVKVDGWTAEAPDAAPRCGDPVEGVAPLLAGGTTVLVADPLGTRELPDAAARMLCDAAEKKLPVALALSVPSVDQSALEEYLASAGTNEDLERLLVLSDFFRRVDQDGRSSAGVIHLVEAARRLRARGSAISLVAFDSKEAAGNAREAEMAANLLAFRQEHPDAWMLVLAGDVHVRTGGVGWDSKFEPMGRRLTRAQPSSPVLALEVGFARGAHYACRFNVWEQVDCDVHGINPTVEARQEPNTPRKVAMFASRGETGFHGRLYLGTLSPSLPVLHRAVRAPEKPEAAHGEAQGTTAPSN